MLERTTRPISKSRGILAISAGIFVIVLMSAVWIFVAHLVATHAVEMEGSREFFGRLYLAFGMIVFCGILGTINGFLALRTGSTNGYLVALVLVIFGAALYIMYEASKLVPAT
jgi:hypothetical protein